MTNKYEVLKKLFTDDADINADDFSDLLFPFIKINKSNKSIILLDSTLKHPHKNRVLLFLLGKKALFLMGEIETDHVKPKDLIKETGIPRGSVLPTLMQLKENSLVTSDNKGYYVTSYQVSKIKTNKSGARSISTFDFPPACMVAIASAFRVITRSRRWRARS